MNGSFYKKPAEVFSIVSAYFGIPMEKEDVITYCLKSPRNFRSRALNRKLGILLSKIIQANASGAHKLFWKTVEDLVRNARDFLSGKNNKFEIGLHPIVPKKLRKSASREDVCSVLKIAAVHCPVPFWFAAPELLHSSVSKLSEGSFGEIFEITKADGEKRILKIVPVGDSDPQTRQIQLTFKDITAEISASVELATLLHDKRNRCPSFPRIYRVCVVQDTFPETAIKAWKAYSSNNSTYHPSPDAYKPDQAFITIETESAGKSLETYLVGSYLKAISIFKQVALAVAVAEEKLEFEHRDLHVENILIRECEEKKLDFKLRNRKFSVDSHGVKATIIDFTYSRIMTGDGVKYLNLDNIYDPRSRSPDEFLDHRYVYARMGEITQRNWQEFYPKTNILWLKHTLVCLLKSMDAQVSKPLGRLQNYAFRTLWIYNYTCLLYDSASQFVRDIVLK